MAWNAYLDHPVLCPVMWIGLLLQIEIDETMVQLFVFLWYLAFLWNAEIIGLLGLVGQIEIGELVLLRFWDLVVL